MFTKYFTCNTKQKTDHEASQDNKNARKYLGTWKVKFNWNNCLLQRWICYRYYRYSSQNHFTGSTKVFLNQSLYFLINQPIMWNHDILDLRKSFDLQVKKLCKNSSFAGSNMKACKRVLIFFGKSHVTKTYTWFSTIY